MYPLYKRKTKHSNLPFLQTKLKYPNKNVSFKINLLKKNKFSDNKISNSPYYLNYYYFWEKKKQIPSKESEIKEIHKSKNIKFSNKRIILFKDIKGAELNGKS